MSDELFLPPVWEAHDDPTRPLDPNVLLCACVDCETATKGADGSAWRKRSLRAAYSRALTCP